MDWESGRSLSGRSYRTCDVFIGASTQQHLVFTALFSPGTWLIVFWGCLGHWEAGFSPPTPRNPAEPNNSLQNRVSIFEPATYL